MGKKRVYKDFPHIGKEKKKKGRTGEYWGQSTTREQKSHRGTKEITFRVKDYCYKEKKKGSELHLRKGLWDDLKGEGKWSEGTKEYYDKTVGKPGWGGGNALRGNQKIIRETGIFATGLSQKTFIQAVVKGKGVLPLWVSVPNRRSEKEERGEAIQGGAKRIAVPRVGRGRIWWTKKRSTLIAREEKRSKDWHVLETSI